MVFGKPAIEWVMERQAVTTHKESDIVSDANNWAIETMGNPAYSLELLQKIITVESLRAKFGVGILPVYALPHLGDQICHMGAAEHEPLPPQNV